MTASYCTLSLFISFFIAISGDFLDCFTSHRNVRVTCVKPAMQRIESSTIQCEELCFAHPEVCRTAQFDIEKKICEIFSFPSLLKTKTKTNYKGRRRLNRNVDFSTKSFRSCSPALQPSIGTVYLVPRQECFDDLKPIAFMEGAVVPTLKEKVIATQIGQEQSHPPRDPFSAIPVEVLPIIPDCPIGEKARTQIIDGVEVVSAASATFRVDSPEKCVHACMTSSYPDGSRLPLLCRSSQFVRKSFKCSVYPDALNPNGYLEYKPNPNVLYMEKLCISEEILPLSCDEIFRRIPQHVIIGHASEILTVSSEEECICECILAKVKRDIDCRSLLHYPEVQTSNCILNIHSRLTRSEYFMPELEYKVDYVQIPECARKAGGANLDSTVSNNREPLMSIDTRIVENDKDFGLPPGIGSVESEWSEWTTCDPKTSTHRRERLCTDCVEQIQIQPCFSNNNFDDILESFVTEQDKVGLPGSQRLKPTKNKPSINIIPFPISQMIAENNKTADMEYFGPPFENLSPTWKSTFRRI